MQTLRLVDNLPLAAVFIVNALVLAAVLELGYRLGRRRRQGPVGRGQAATMLGATMALLSFTLALTVGFANDRFADRRAVLVAEANSIGTTWLRSRALPPGYGEPIGALLEEYLDARIPKTPRITTAELDEILRRSEDLHRRLWAKTIELARAFPNSVPVGLFMHSLNQMIELQAKRAAILRRRIPLAVWSALFFVALSGTFTLGYQGGKTGPRELVIALGMVLSFAAMFTLIAGLDRTEQAFGVAPRPMLDLQRTMRMESP